MCLKQDPERDKVQDQEGRAMKKRPVRRMIAAALALIMLLAASATAYAEEPVIGEEEQEIQTKVLF